MSIQPNRLSLGVTGKLLMTIKIRRPSARSKSYHCLGRLVSQFAPPACCFQPRICGTEVQCCLNHITLGVTSSCLSRRHTSELSPKSASFRKTVPEAAASKPLVICHVHRVCFGKIGMVDLPFKHCFFPPPTSHASCVCRISQEICFINRGSWCVAIEGRKKRARAYRCFDVCRMIHSFGSDGSVIRSCAVPLCLDKRLLKGFSTVSSI